MACHDDADTEATDIFSALHDTPEDGATHLLEGNRLRRMRPYAAHEEPLWRLCNLDAAFSRAGAAPIAYW